MSSVSDRTSAARDSLLRAHFLAIAYRGDAHYLREPAAGTFAVLDLRRGRKAFFAVPHGATPEALRALIEGRFGAPVERVTEFLWAV